MYHNGEINATSAGRRITLHIGSREAAVSGIPQELGVAPLLIGDTTYVPLRCVAQSLGAVVIYDNSDRHIYISSYRNGALHRPPPGRDGEHARHAGLLRISSPVSGDRVDRRFLVSGKTLPYAVVHIAVRAASAADVASLGSSAVFYTHTTADENGMFSQPVRVDAPEGHPILLSVSARDPETHETAEENLRLRSR